MDTTTGTPQQGLYNMDTITWTPQQGHYNMDTTTWTPHQGHYNMDTTTGGRLQFAGDWRLLEKRDQIDIIW